MRISDWSSDVCSSDLLAQHFTVQTEFLDQRAEGADRHTKVADIGIGGVVAAKRDAYTPKYRDRTTGPHAFTPCSSSSGGAPNRQRVASTRRGSRHGTCEPVDHRVRSGARYRARNAAVRHEIQHPECS